MGKVLHCLRGCDFVLVLAFLFYSLITVSLLIVDEEVRTVGSCSWSLFKCQELLQLYSSLVVLNCNFHLASVLGAGV